MQTDMHYYGTYALARAAGIKPLCAEQIAVAAQFVDDSRDQINALADAAFLDFLATAHGTSMAIKDIKDTEQNSDIRNQRQVWLPFHFLPGGKGDSLAEKLTCQMDSAIAQQMVQHHLAQADSDYGLALIGITAHVYADTFSHYGFLGIGHPLNRVDGDSFDLQIEDASVLDYVKEKAQDFFEAIEGQGAELLTQLGHGGAATFPDRPYLKWSFKYEDGRESGLRENQKTFHDACIKLHAMFAQLAAMLPQLSDGDARPFGAIDATLQAILALEGDMDARIAKWQQHAVAGDVFNNPAGTPIPAYDETVWQTQLAALAKLDAPQVKKEFAFRFTQAAQVHRQYVLHKLLPAEGIDAVLP